MSRNEQKQEFQLLLGAGNYCHNCRVLATQQGHLILARRPGPTGSTNLKDYVWSLSSLTRIFSNKYFVETHEIELFR